MKKTALGNALNRLLRLGKHAGRDESLLFQELEARILFSAAPLDPAAPPPEPEAEAVVEVATLSAGVEKPSATNPGSLANALQATPLQLLGPAASSAAPASGGNAQAVVERLAAAAAQRWDAAGLSSGQRDALANVRYEIRDLGGLAVAWTQGEAIVIDDDAAGRGWYVDETPGDDAEFLPGREATRLLAQDAEAKAGVDLLTILIHEQGHLLGLGDAYRNGDSGDVMYGGVEQGLRRLPTTGQAGLAEQPGIPVRQAASLTVNTFNDVLNAGDGLLSLREAINQAVNGDVIVLGPGTYLMELTASNENANAGGDFDISGKQITIQGAGIGETTIDGCQLDRVLHIYNGASVTIRDLTITGGKLNYAHGAGLAVEGTTTTVSLENVRIDANRVETPDAANVDRWGGGLYVNGSLVTGTNVEITNNLATRVGAGRNPYGAGLFLNSTATLELTHSVISNNTNTHFVGGGAFVNTGSTLTLVDTTLAGNAAIRSSGGGVYVAFGGTANLRGVTVDANRAVSGGGIFGAVGAAVHITNSALTRTVISANQAYNADLGGNSAPYGGGIRVDGSTLTITGDTALGDVLIRDNTAFATNFGTTGFQGAYGGGLAIRSESQATLQRVTISGNLVNRSDNAAGDGAGLFIEQAGTTVSGSHVTITGNIAKVRGGGVRVGNPGAQLTLTDSLISANRAENEYGAGIHNNGTISLVNTDLEGNVTLDLDNSNRRDGHGGGFYNGQGGILNFDASSDVRGNSAYGYGGGGFNDGGVINASGNTWEWNTTVHFNSGRNGGALWNYLGGIANLDSVIFQDNATGADAGGVIQGSGGAILNSDQGILNITGASVFQRNLAASGGAISTYSNGSVVNITGSASANVLIQDNWARADGGGLRQDSELAKLVLAYVTIRNNIAENSDGGGIANHNGIIRAEHVTITNNAAGTANDHDGGGLYAVNRADVSFADSVISNNAAFDDGGGIYGSSVAKIRFENTIISGNKAGIDHRTGAGYHAGANTIGSVTVLGDVTTANGNSDANANEGGGLYLVSNGTVEFIGCSIVGNIADDSGGGIHAWDELNLVVSHSLIAGNLAGFNAPGTAIAHWDRHGGGIRLGARAKITLSDSAILSNEASGDGAGLAVQDDAAFTILRSTLADNVAAFGGGAVHSLSANNRGAIVNSTLSGNYAGYKRAANGGVLAAESRAANDGDANTNSRGGAIYHENGVTDVIHSTIAWNTAESSYVADAGGGIRRISGTVNLTASVLTQNRETVSGFEAANEFRGALNLVDSYYGTDGAELAPLSDAFEVGARNAGANASASARGMVRVHIPDAGAVNIVNAVDAGVLASDQTGRGRGGSAVPSDRGAVEREALPSAIILDALKLPATCVSGDVIEAAAVASSLGGGGTLRLSWSVSGGTSAVAPVTHDFASPGAGENDSFRFTHVIANPDTVSENLTVTLTLTDLTTLQSVTETRTVRVLNPDAMPASPAGTIQVTTASDVVNPGDGKTSLREAISAANASAAGDFVITFAAGLNGQAITTTLATNNDNNAGGDFDITKTNGAVFLVGNGAASTIVHGGGLDRVFDVRPNATVVFRNLTITGGNTEGAGGSDHGAGFRALGSTVLLNGVNLTGNQSIRGTGGVGGGFYATNNGLTGATVVMKGGAIERNSAGGSGGGWYASGTSRSTTLVHLEDVTIAGNVSLNESTPVISQDGGGFLFTGQDNELRLKNVLIADNSAVDDGGGFAIFGENHRVLFENVTIQRNAVEGVIQDTDPASSFNAVTFNSQATQVVTGTTPGESARDGGGGLIDATNTTVTFIGGLIGGERNPDGTIKDGNYADNNGAGLMVRGLVTVSFDGTAIRGNFSEDSGAGLAIDGPATVTFRNGTIADNASIDEQGGGVAVFSGTFTGTNLALTGNRAGDRIYNANPGDRVGGAMYVTNASKVSLEDVAMTGNQAEGRGGALYADRSSVVTITSHAATSTISGNSTMEDSSSRGGGAFWISQRGTILNVTGAIVANNRTADEGGAFFLQGAAAANLTDVVVEGNESHNGGGGIFTESDQSVLNLTRVVVRGNATRVSAGGGIYTNSMILANEVILEGNKAGFDLEDGQVASGTNDRIGGGLFIAGAEAGFVGANVVIAGNESYGRGGGVFVTDGRLELDNFVVRGNRTNSDGNVDRGRGGGVYGESLSTVILTNGEVSENLAEGHGGGLYQASDGSRIALTNVTVSGNSAGYDLDSGGLANRASDGGGIYSTSYATLTLDHVTVAGNQATRNGGGVHREAGWVTYRNSILSGNIANAESVLPGDPPLASDSNGEVTLEGSVLLMASQGGTVFNSERRFAMDPNLGALADNQGAVIAVAGSAYVARTHALPSNSVASGAAAGSTLSQDQRGVARPAGFADLGAYQAGGRLSLASVTASTLAPAAGAAVTVTGDVVHALGVAPLAGDVHLTIDWGDGAEPYRAFFAAGSDLSAAGDFSASHVYSFGLDGVHLLRVSLTDLPGGIPLASETFTVTATAGGGPLVVRNVATATNEDSAVTINPLDPRNPGAVRTGDLLVPETTGLAGGNRLGWSVAIDGDLAVVGSEGQNNQEEVYVYRRNATTGAWTLEQTLFNDYRAQFDDFGFSVAVDAANGRIFVGAELDDTGGTDKGAVYFYEYDPGLSEGSRWVMRQKIQAATGSDSYDNFGSSLAAAGGVLAVGARVEDADSHTDPADRAGADDSGAVYLFSYNTATGLYDLAQKLKARTTAGASDVGAGDQFGVSVALDETGTRLVAGAELNDDSGANSGAAYVYRFEAANPLGSQWVIEQKLSSPSEHADDRFGYRVDISGDTIVVGARLDDTGGSNRGAVFVFQRSGTVWGHVQTLGSGVVGVSNDDYFGGAVAVDGNRLLVGAYLDDLTGKSNVGRAYLFERANSASNFAFVKNLDSADGAAGDQFGLGLALSGDRYLIGARLADASVAMDGTTSIPISQWGAAYLYEGSGSAAVQVAKLDGNLATRTDIPAKVEFGRRVAIRGDWALVGAPRDGKAPGGDDERTGRAYLYQRDDRGTPDVGDDTWTLVASLVPPTTDDDFDDFFGFGVDLSADGSVAVVSSMYHETAGANRGAVYLFERNSDGNGYALRGRIRPGNPSDYDEFGRKVALSEDGLTLVVGMRSDDDGASNSGSAHIYEATAGGWAAYFAAHAITEQGIPSVNSDGTKLKPVSDKTTTATSEFGMAVTMSGNRIAVGAWLDDLPDDNDADNPSRNRGSVYLYERDSAGLHGVIDPFVNQAQIAIHATTASGIHQVQIVTGSGLSVAVSGGVVTITLGAGGSSAAAIVAAVNSAGIAGFSAELFTENGADDAPNDGSGVIAAASSTDLHAWRLVQKLVASNQGKDDQFGRSVAIEGDVLVVGAFLEDSSTEVADNGNAGDSGAAYVYELRGGRWVETQRLKASDPGGSDQFGMSVAVDGDVIVVGAFAEDTSGPDAGSVYVYQRDPGRATGFQWQQTSLIRAPLGSTDDQFGISVDVSGRTVLVGAAQASRTLSSGLRQVHFGAAYTYHLAEPALSAVTDLGELRLPDGTPLARANRMGWSVAIDGDLAVVGSEGQNAQEEVYVYRRNALSGAWELEQTLFNDSVEEYDDFGFSVAVDAANGRIFVGAEVDDAGGGDKGAVHYYAYDPGQPAGRAWVLRQKIQAVTTGNSYDNFGSALAVSPGMLAVGARVEDADSITDPADTAGADDSGAVYLFTYNAGTGVYDFAQKIKAQTSAGASDVGAGDQFGVSVAFDETGSRLVVGAEYNDDTGSNSGSTYVYRRIAGNPPGSQWVIEQKLSSPSEDADDRFGYRVDISGDTIAVGARLDNTGGTDRGSVFLYRWDPGSSAWTHTQTLGSGQPGVSDYDYFGSSVALEGDRLLVGSYLDDQGGENSGSAYVFERASSAAPFQLVRQLRGVETYGEFGLGVAMSGDRYLIGARLADARLTAGQETLTVSQWGAAYLFEGSGANISPVQKLDGGIETKAAIGGFFEYGRRVAVSGDYAVVGAPRMGKIPGVNDESTGRAYVFHRNDAGTVDAADDSWSLIATLAPPVTDDDFDDFFGFGVTVSEDGSTVAVGALYHEAAGVSQGAVYLFQRNAASGEYDLKGRIRAADRNDYDEFGRQVALNEDGSVLVVGGWLDDDSATNAGAVFVYDVRGSTWSDFFAGAPLQQGAPGVDSNGIKLQAAAPEAEARLGRTVAISGTTIVAGAYAANHPAGADAGAAYIFEFNGLSWAQTAELRASNPGAYDYFGVDVDIDGDTVIVGAYAEDSNTDGTGNTIGDSGAAYLFERIGGAWVETRMLKAEDASGSDQFGISVAIDGDLAVVGAFLADAHAQDSGAVYVFQRGAGWAQTQVVRSPYGGVNDNFGRSVDVAGGVIVAGAPNADRVLADGTVIKAFGGVHSWQISPADRVSGSSLAITGVSTPARGSVTTDGSTITFDPGDDFDFLNPGETATETFTYTVRSAGGATATGQVTVTITGRNDSPIAVSDAVTLSEDDPPVTGNLLSNDRDDDAGTALSIVRINGQVASLGVPLTLASGALLTIHADGSYTYDPNGKFQSLAQGQSITDSFTYQITDSAGQVVYQAVEGVFAGEAEVFSWRSGTGANFWQPVGESSSQNVNGFTGSREAAFVQVPDGGGALLTPVPGFPGQPAIAYQIEVTEPGSYQLFVRAGAFDGNSDSLYAAILHQGDAAAGGAPDWYRVNVPATRSFQWLGTGATESTNATDPAVPMTFTLAAGVHTLVFSPREDGVAVDSWMLRKTDAAVPAPGATERGPNAQQVGTVTFTVQGANDAPTAMTLSQTSVAENSPGAIVGALLVDDPDAASSHSFAVNDARFEVVSGQLKLKAGQSLNFESEPSVVLSITATDEGNPGLSLTRSFTLAVQNVNEAPAPADAAIDLVETTPDGSLVCTVAPNDPDIGDAHTFAITAGNTGNAFAIDSAGRILVANASLFNPGQVYNLTVQVRDQGGAGLVDSALIRVAITDQDTAPTAVTLRNAIGSLPEGSDTTAPVKVADITITDDGSGTNVLSLAGTDAAKFSVSGSQLFLRDGVLDFDTKRTYNVTVNVDGLGVGTAVDASAFFVLNVANVAPAAQIGGPAAGVEGSPVSLTASGSDPGLSQEPLSFAWSVSKNGTPGFAGGTGPAIGFTPDDNGTYLVTLTARDPAGLASAPVHHTVTVANASPIPRNDHGGSTTEDGPVTTPSVLANDSDPAGSNDPLTILSADTVSAAGALVIHNGDGTFSYDPNGKFEHLAAGETATDTFRYSVSDGDGGSATATVTVTIVGANDAPLAGPDYAATGQGTPIHTGQVLLNDADPDLSDVIAISGLDTSGTQGLVLYNGDGTFTYDPNGQFTHLGAGESATDSFAYTVSDGHGGLATGIVTITIHGLNDAPSVASDAVTIDENTATGTAIARVLASDPDTGGMHELSYAIVGGNESGAFAIDPGTGIITVADSSLLDHETTPGFQLTVAATDLHGAGLTAYATISIRLNDVPVSQSLTEVYQGYSLTVFDDRSGASQGLFLGAVPASVMADVYAGPGMVSDDSVILDLEQPTLPAAELGSATVLAGFTVPGLEVGFSVTDAGGEVVRSGRGAANSRGTFLLMLDLSKLADMSGGGVLWLEFSQPDGSVKTVGMDLAAPFETAR